VRQGFEVHVIAPLRNGDPIEENDMGVKVHRVPPPFSLGAFRVVRGLVERPEEWIIHTHATSGFLLATLKHFLPYRVFAHVHGTSKRRLVGGDGEGKREGMFEPLVRMTREKISWSSAQKVFSICNFVSDDLIRYYKIKSSAIRTVYNGVDERAFRLLDSPQSLCPKLDDKRVILYVGHFGTRKGVRYAIRAMKDVKKEVTNAHLLCIGGVPRWLGQTDHLGMLKREVEANDLSEHVTLMDAVPNGKLANAYSSAALLVFPSYNEACPKVVLEAMSCSKPVIATNGGGIPELVEDGKTGRLVGYGAVRDLATAITELLLDEHKSREMGRAGRARVEGFFTWAKVAERIGMVYAEN
jgi:starch synthase